MTTPRIRVLALAVCVERGRILVERGIDTVKDHRFYRAIGGGVDFGEHAADAAIREWREELDVTLESLRPLGVLENIFTYEGRPGHEVVFAYSARVAEAWIHETESFERVEASGLRHEVVWVPLAELRAGGPPLYPPGLVELLDGVA
jgi:ADP-ribose pyrophosphatase YjhB (NUDIX family)